MQKQTRILIVDDDPQICELVQEYLEQYDCKVYTAKDGISMQKILKTTTVDLIILDIMLPGEDGISLCRKLRQTSDVSIIMLSAAGSETDRVLGLEIGADDYLTKPFSPRELLARVKALLRRTHGELGQKRQTSKLARIPNLSFLNWSLDRNLRKLTSPENLTVPLSKSEYDLLLVFLENPMRIMNRDQLLDILTGQIADPFDRSIDVRVARLRKKIEEDPKNPKIILTLRGDGYQFNANVTETETES